MIDEWIKMRIRLPDEPEVVGMANVLGVTPEHVCGCLLRVWGLGDGHAVSRICPGESGTNVPHIEGHLSRYKLTDIDRKAGLNEFAAAMVSVGWLVEYPDGVAFPHWDKHHSRSSKERACEQKKKAQQRKTRDKCPGESGTNVPAAPGPQNKREKKSNTEKPPNPPLGGEIAKPTSKVDATSVPIPATLDTPEFRVAWSEWIAERRDRKKPITPRAAGQQLAKLAEVGPDAAIETIRRSIANGWQGLFPEADRGPPRAGYQTRTDEILSWLED